MSRKTRQAEIEVRRQQVAANLLGGLNYREMADALGVSIGTIASDVKMIMKRWEHDQLDKFDAWVMLEDRRYDRLLNGIWDKATGGDLRAVDRALRIEDQRAKLKGLYAPEKHAMTDAEGNSIKFTVGGIDIAKDV